MKSSAREELIARLTDLGAQSTSLTALFQQKVASSYGLGVTDLKALDVLVRSGAQTPGQLGEVLGLTSGAVTGVVDRLIRRGFARREADARDRRRVFVTADLEAITAEPNAYEGIARAFRALHESLTTAELELVARYLEQSVAITQRELERLS